MSWWRPVTVLVLLVFPVAVFVAAGTWSLWQQGHLFWMWWLFPLGWGAAYLIARRWQESPRPFPGALPDIPPHWTHKDEQALRIVEAEQQRVRDIPPDRFTEPRFYLDAATDLAKEIARHYHPRAKDPYSSLTVPEILAVSHLALEDLERWVERYVPASHLLTVRHWRLLAKTPKWYRVVRDASWVASMLISPANVGRYILSRMTIDTASQQLQANMLAWFYVMFIRHVGFYVIEMNSGRLRGGADRYREALQRFHRQSEPDKSPRRKRAPAAPADGAEEDEPLDLTVAVIGQVKSGKSSVINALLGRQRAAVDVLPMTSHVQAYRLEIPDVSERLVFLDTIGYADEGATREQKEATREACRQADLVLLCFRANDPARQADLEVLRGTAEWFLQQSRLRPPPVLGVMTHIDALSPAMQWEPPYQWQKPKKPKEQSIHAALRHNQQQFDTLVAAIVPVCADLERGREYGVHQWLLPAMTALLSEARSVALVRALRQDVQADGMGKVLAQLRDLGTQLIDVYLNEKTLGSSRK